MRKYTVRLLVALVAFIVGMAAATLWVIKRTNTGSRPTSSNQRVKRKPRLNVPLGWQKLDADGLFTFYLPSGMKIENGGGIETYYRTYTSENIKINVSYGNAWVNSITKQTKKPADYQVSSIEIDGRRGMMSVYGYRKKGKIVEAYIPNVGRGDQQFTMSAIFLDE